MKKKIFARLGVTITLIEGHFPGLVLAALMPLH